MSTSATRPTASTSAAMLAKQYTIKLPADYDMEIIQQRVRDRGSGFDAFPGLTFKAFLITERTNRATVNSYAPFYLWHETSGTNEFLYGEGFAAIQGSFGRPLIEHWIGLELRAEEERREAPPRSATRQDLSILEQDELAEVRRRELDWLDQCRSDPRGMHTAITALDPYRWRLVRFVLWNAPVAELSPSSSVTSYEVLHLSAPGIQPLS